MTTTSRLLPTLALLVLVLSLGGCGGDEPATSRTLLIFGLDSADWHLLDPMIEEGRLPHMKAFRMQAASGRMETLVPLTKSPILWASIFTGRRPEVHGIGGFVKSDGMEISGAADWRAPALWDIAGPAGLSTTVLGMWSTHPARPIEGVMVSDFLPYGHGRDRARDGLVFPDSLAADILGRSVDPAAVPWTDLARFLPDGALDEALRDHADVMEDLRQIYAADLGYFETARWLAAEHPTDVFVFYLRGPDMVSHRFWKYMEPDKGSTVVSARQAELFGEVVRRYYEFCDDLMGEVLGWFPADAPTVVLSDHGFYGPRKTGKKGTAEHSKWGVFLARGPQFEPGSTFDSIHIYDIAPTFLAMLGLPPAADMPGRILDGGLSARGEALRERLEAGRIDSYQALSPRGVTTQEVDPAVNEEIRRQLQSLGYIN